MEHQIIEDWSKWAKIGYMPQRPRCTLNLSQNKNTPSPYFTENDFLNFDKKIAALSKEYPLNGQMFKLRYLNGMTYAQIAKKLHITPQRVQRMIKFFISKTEKVT